VNNDLFSSGLPDMDIPAQNGLANIRFGYSNGANNCNCPLREREQQFQLVDNWTRNAGGHVFKWGGDLHWLQNFRLASDRRRAGHFIFSSDITALQMGGTGPLGQAAPNVA